MVTSFFVLIGMGWKTIIIGAECTVSLTLNRMKVTIGEEYHNIPLNDLDTVIFSHDRMSITIPLLAKLIEHNINIIICDSKNDPIGIFQPFNNHSLVFKQLNNQINWKLTRKKKLWKFIVENKIQTELDALALLEKIGEATDSLKAYRDSVYTDDQTNREAVSARVYFSALFGNEFKREINNPTNAALNYGYKIIASYISKCIASRGLLTQIGIHHKGEANPFNLTYDFIEPFRCIIDIWVYLHVSDSFTIAHKRELIEILQCKIQINKKWMRLNDAIEDIIDSYIGFLNEKEIEPIMLNVGSGIEYNGE